MSKNKNNNTSTATYFYHPKIDKEEILAQCQKLSEYHTKALAQSFMGIRVVVDNNLKGNEYYFCISPELFAAIELEKQKQQ